MSMFTSSTESMIMTKGNCPILLLSVHGGYIDIPCGSSRPKYNNTVCNNDLNTLELTEKICNHLEKLGIIPYKALNLVIREDVDLNRNLTEGTNYSCKHSIQFYSDFHDSLDSLVIDSLKHFGKCLILDIHGNSLHNTIQLGFLVPLNKLIKNDYRHCSIKTIISTDDTAIIKKEKSIFYYMEKNLKNVIIFPNSGETDPELIKKHNYLYYHGAYIGNKYKDICDYLQVEISQDLRVRRFSWTANNLAKTIYKWYTDVYSTL